MKKLLAIAFGFILSNTLFAQSAFEYGIPNRSISHSFYAKQSAELSNGKIVTVGYNSSLSNGQIIIHNTSGDTSKIIINNSSDDNIFNAIAVYGNSFIVAGDINTGTDRDVILKKYTNSGTLLWTKTLTLPNNQHAKDIFCMSNGQMIIAAMTNYSKVEFFKTDSTGVELSGWPKSYNANNQMGVHQDLNRMAFTYNGTHVIGAVQDYQQNNRVRIFTFNPATGSLGQDTLMGASNVDIQPRAVISSGSKVYVTGYSNPNNEYKEFVAAWDTAAGANGNWLVNNIDMSPGAQGGHTCGIALSIKNGDLYVLGQGWIQNVGWHMELRKLSSTGSTLWFKQYVGDGDMSYSERASIINLTSGQFFITSQMRATWRSSRNDNWNYLTYFARVNADGSLNKMKFRLGEDFFCEGANTWVYSWARDRNSNYSWTQPNGNTSTNNGVNVGNAGDYYFTATDVNGDNVSSDTLTIYAGSAPIIYNDLGAYSACIGDSVELKAFSTISLWQRLSTFNWYRDNVSLNLTDTIIYAKVQGTYKLVEIDSNGCPTSSTQPVAINNPIVEITGPTSALDLTSGTGTTTNASTINPDVLGVPWGYFALSGQTARSQFILTAAELQTMGLRKGMEIKSIAFDVATIGTNSGTSNYLSDFRVGIINAPSTFSGFAASGSSRWAVVHVRGNNTSNLYYENNSFYPGTSTGWKTLTFNQNSNFVWDGVSDVVIDVSYTGQGGAGSTNYRFNQSATSYVASKTSRATSTSTSIGNVLNIASQAPTSSYRPNMRFGVTQVKREGVVISCESPVSLGISTENISNLSSSLNTINWSQGNLTGTSTTFSASSDGEVTLQFVDAIGCNAHDTINLKFSAVSASISTLKGDTACFGSTIDLTGNGSSDYAYSWSNGLTTQTATVSASGSYTLNVIDSLGCSDSESFSVRILDEPTIFSGDEPAHTGDAISDYTYLGEYNGNHYYWTNSWFNYIDAKASAESNGGHLWKIEDLQENSAISQLFRDAVGCCADLAIGAIKVNGTYQWYDGTPVSFTNWYSGQPDEPSSYYIQVHPQWGTSGEWDDWGNQSDGRRWVVEFEDLTQTVTSNTQICDSILLKAPKGYDTYTWNDNTNNSTLGTGRTIWVSDAVNVSVAASFTHDDATICTVSSSGVSLTINSSPQANIINYSGTVDLFGGDSVILGSSTSSGASVSWYESGNSAVISTNDTLFATTPNWYSLTATLNGCATTDSISISAPVFVSTTGSNTSGDGSLANPYETIQFGIDQASSGGKVYVLPGTYEERILIDKPLTLASDVLRTGDTNAIRTTIIKPGSVGIIQSVTNSNITAYGGVNISQLNEGHVQVVGFSINDFQANYSGSWDGSSAISVVHSSADIDFENIIVSGSKQAQGQGCCNAAVTLDVEYSSNVSFTDVRFKNNGEPSNSSHRLAYLRQSTVGFDNVRWVNNDYFSNIVRFGDNTVATFTNNAFINGGGGQLFQLDASNIDIVFNHVTIANNDDLNNIFSITGSNNEIWFANSVLEGDMTDYWMNSYGSNNSMYVANSVIGGTSKASFSTSNLTLDTNGLTLYSTPSLNNGGSLKSISPAIGIGRTPTLLAGKTLTSPSTDLNGVNRPNPAGSNPDAGAFESAKAIGDFDVTISSCGYLITPSILNTSNYLVEWSGPNGFSSFDEEILVSEKGTYVLNVYALDRSDTITKSYALNNPLSFDISLVKNVCEAVSSSSGSIEVRNMTGGTIFQQGWGDYYLRIYSGTSEVWSNNIYNGPSAVATIGNRTAGEYIVRLEDATACYVYDTVEILSKASQTVYVSPNGNNANSGTELNPYKNIQYAIDQSCDRDTIILLNGTHLEDGIVVNKPLFIASKYILSGDTNDINTTIVKGNSQTVFIYQDFPGSINDTTYSQLIGLTITGGSGNNGGAVYVRNYNGGASVKIDNCVITDNSANYGGGVFKENWAHLVISNSIISANQASSQGGGLTAHGGGSLYLRNVTIEKNSANDFGGIHIGVQMMSSYENLIIRENTGYVPAGEFSVNSGAKLKNITVIDNVGGSNSQQAMRIYFDQWNSPYQGDGLVFENFLFARNVTESSPGLHIGSQGNYSFINSTFSDNTSRNTSGWNQKGNININDNVHLRLLNSIVTKNNGLSIIGNGCGTSSVSARFSVIEGGSTAIKNESCGTSGTITKSLGTSVITTAPYFVDRSHGDYRLANYASSIGAGRTTADVGPSGAIKTLTAPTVDIENSIRPNPAGSKPDLGVYEHPDSVGTAGLDFIIVNNGVCQTNSGSIAVQLIDPTGSTAGIAKAFLWTKVGDAAWGQMTTNSITGLASGKYYVVVTAGTVLTLMDTVEIVTAGPISVANASISATCFAGEDGVLKFSIGGGSPFTGGTFKYDIQYLDLDSLGYSWSDINSQERSANYSQSNMYPGSYRVVVTDKKGCQFTDTVVVGYRNSLPDLTLTASGPVTFCNGETVTLTAATTDVTDSYLWQDGANLAQITVGNTAMWTVTVTDTAGCTTSDSVYVEVKQTPQAFQGATPLHTGDAINGYTYVGEYNGSYIYHSPNYTSWNGAKSAAESLGAELWYPTDATENSFVTSWYKQNVSCCGGQWIGISRASTTSSWVAIDGSTPTYTNWDINWNQSWNHGFIQMSWNGNWDANSQGTNYRYFIVFRNNSVALNAVETHCDSITVWAPEGFDAYSWSDPNTGTVFGTDRTLKVTSSKTLKVTTTLNKTDNTSCQMESQNYTININHTPSVVFTSDAKVKSDSTDVVTIDALSSSAGAIIQWVDTTAAGSSLTTSTLGYHALTITENGCSRVDSVNYQWYCDTAEFSGMGPIYLKDSVGNILDTAVSNGSYGPPTYGMPILKVATPGSYIITSGDPYAFMYQGNGKYILAIKEAPVVSIVNLSNKIDVDSTAIDLYASNNSINAINWKRGNTLLGTGDSISITTDGYVTAIAQQNGCTTKDSIRVYEPVYVSTSGSNTTGDGSWANPYKTIQHGINQASDGGKVYVLPGTYEERIILDRSVKVYSDAVRLGNANAVATTIIKPGTDGSVTSVLSNQTVNGLVNIKGVSGKTIEFKGFTVKNHSGTGNWPENQFGAITVENAYNSNILFEDLVVRDNSPSQCCQDGSLLMLRNNSYNGEGSLTFENVQFLNNYSTNTEIDRLVYIHYSDVVFSNVLWKDNGARYRLIRINQNSDVDFINNAFVNNNKHYNEYGIISLNWNSTADIVGTTFGANTQSEKGRVFTFEGGQNNSIRLINSVVEDRSGQTQMVYLPGGSNNSFTARNSVIPGWANNETYSALLTDVDSTNTTQSASLTTAKKLNNNSPAIGLARANVTVGSTLYTMPSTDLAGNARPNPAGSNPDAGAYENTKAVGDFDVTFSSCGYVITPSILNSTNYLVEWTGPNNFLAFTEEITAPNTGVYTLNVYALDLNDTVVKTYNLNNPLDFDIILSKDVCEAVSSSSGKIQWGNVTGGTDNNDPNNWWANRTWILDGSGNNFTGDWWIGADGENWQNTRDGLSAGTYVVQVKDGVGCIVSDTVEIGSKSQQTIYVSASGDNANSGNRLNPYKTLKYAVSQSCDQDTIILLDGVHLEDSILVQNQVIIASEFILDGNVSHIAQTTVRGSHTNAVFYYRNVGSTNADTLHSQLVGITIEGGNNPASDRAGGVDIIDAIVKIDHSVIQNNQGHIGGGVAAYGWNTRLVISNSTIANNISTGSSGGLDIREIRRLYLRNSRIFDNTSNGDNGGARIRYIQYATITDLVVEENYSNGSYPVGEWYINGAGIFRNITLRNNVGGNNSNHPFRFKQEGWNDPAPNSPITFYNLQLTGNLTQSWPAMYIDGSTQVSLVNSLVSDNSSRNASGWEQKGNIVIGDNVHLRLLNSIVTKNNGLSIIGHGCGTSSVSARFSVIEGGSTAIKNESCGTSGTITKSLGTSVITTAPYFVDRSHGDYRLANFASSIGAGRTTADVGPTGSTKTLTAPTVDIENSIRPNPAGSKPDLGVYEHPDSVGTAGLDFIIVNNGVCQTNSGSIAVQLIDPTGSTAGIAKAFLWTKVGDAAWGQMTTNSITGLASGKYYVVVTAGTVLTLTDTAVVVTASPISIANASISATCFAGDDGKLKFNISGGSPFIGGTYKYDIQYLDIDGIGYSWTDQSAQERTANYTSYQSRPGSYRIVVTDKKGCQFTDTVVVGYRNSLPDLTLTASGPVTFCNGETVTLTAATTDVTDSYLWQDGANLAQITVGNTAMWTVTVTDTAGCTTSDSVYVEVKQTPQVFQGSLASKTGQAIIGYQYVGSYNGNHIYYNTSGASWTGALSNAATQGGELWYPSDATENAFVTSWYKQHISCCNLIRIGISRASTTSNWVTVNGTTPTYTNWDPNWNQSWNHGFIEMGWNGNWTAGDPNGGYNYFIVFRDNSTALNAVETHCDSITVWAPEGFDAYSWSDPNTGTVFGTDRTLRVTSSKTLKVTTTLNKTDNTSCQMESQNYTININNSPVGQIVNHSGTLDLLGGDTVTLGANYTSGSTIAWFESGVTTSLGANDTLLVTSPATYVLSVTNSGCETRDSVRIDEPIFVATTGSNTTGDGSLANPYKTIQHGINQAPDKGKVYVLPGTYTERIILDRSVKVYSDAVRLGNANAVATTIIKPGTDGSVTSVLDSNGNNTSYGLINIKGVSGKNIELKGFTVKNHNGTAYWPEAGFGAITVWNAYSTNVLFEDMVIRDNSPTQCCQEGSILTIRDNNNYGEGVIRFENVQFLNNYSTSTEIHRFAWIHNSDVVFSNVLWKDNGARYRLIKIQDNSDVDFINNAFENNNKHYNEYGIISLNSNSTADVIGSTFGANSQSANGRVFVFEGSSNNAFRLINSVVEDRLGQTQMVYLPGGSNNSFTARNSVIPGWANNETYSALLKDVDSTNTTQSASLTTAKKLNNNSPAIGLARANVTVGSKLYTLPSTDLAGNARPNPAGSNPDAGAYENAKAVGDFDVTLTSCGYTITPSILNSSYYLVQWNGPSGYISFDEEIVAPRKGLYTLKVFSLDRNDTITKTLNLNNPLEFEISMVKNVCESVSSNSGKIEVRNMRGGTIFQQGFGDYYLRVFENGNQVWQNNIWNGPTNVQTIGNLAASTYAVRLEDAVGCHVFDTITLNSQLGRRWYVSTSGSNSNSGTELSPLRSVQLAYDLACDQDTIIIEDGTYYENLELGNAWQNNIWQYAKPITLASRFILDGLASHIDSVILNGSDEAPVLSARFNGSTDSSSNNVIRLVGMTFTRGNAISYNWWGGNRGGGIALFERGYVLENLKVRNNSSSEYGGGIFIEESAILRNVDVYNNSAQKGAGIYLWNISELYWENVNVFENTSSEWAGGVGIQGSMTSDITISGMNIYNNQNTGWNGASALQIESSGSGTLTLNNFQITSNTNVNSDSWGAVYVSNGANKGVVFENALIAFNKGGWISGVNIQNSADVSFVNSTIYKNLSRAGYTGTYANSSIYLSNNSELNLYNSILGGQTGYNIIFDQANNSWGGADCDVNIKNSLIQGGTSSSSILTTPGVPGQVTDSAMLVEPVYLKNPGQGDFSLAVMSSAIGSADTNMSWLNPGSINNPVYLNMPLQDLYGQSRPNPVGSNADLGAIESELSTAQFGVAFEITTNPACNPSAAQIKATAKHPNGGPYKYLWVSLDGNTINNPNSQLTSGAYTISNLYAGWYKLTVEKYSGSTVVETYVDSVEITQDAPIVLNLDKSNENCENENNGALQVDVEGGSGRYFITWTYPGGISNANAPSTISGLAPGNYSVTVTDDRGCTAQDTAVILTEHPTPVITITSSIAKPGSTLNGNDEVRMCVGDIVTLDAGGGFADYNWTSLTVSANQYSTRTIEAFESETYYLSVVDSFGCANADTARVYVVYPPVVYASNLNVATGANLQGVTTTVMGNNESITDGPWNNNPWNSDPHPYGSNQRYGKVQFVIRASELYQSGLTQNTNINSLSMYVEQSGSSALSNMTISMGHTGQSAMTNWETGLQQVFTINNYFPVSGTWNIHNFANEFKWDGAQNILVEVCFDYGANNPSSVEILKHQIYGNVQLSMSSHSDVNADNCLLPGNTQYSIWRPNVQLGIDKIQAVDTIRVCDFSVLNTAPIYDTYRWYVNGSQIPDTTLITVANTATSVLRVSDAASGCILWSDTIVVAVDSTSSLNITSDLPLSGTYCLGDTLTLSTNKSFAQYFWSNGSTVQQQLVSRSETFVLRAVSENGCASFDTASVIINVPPDVYFRLNGRVLASTDQSLVYNSGGANCTEVRYVPSEDLFDAGWDTTTFINNLTYQSVVSKMDSLLYPWVVDHSQPKDWILHRDTTDTQFSGPNTDATSADGHGGYLLFNPYQGTDENKTAAIVSPCVNLLGTNQPAMVFNYHMYTNINALGGGSATAQQMGSLKVEVQDVTAGETGWTMVWMRDTPTSTDVWVTDTADLSAYAGHSVKLRLKAQAGTGGPNGEIAVDGISFTDLNPSNPVLNRLTPETVCEGDILEAGSSDVLSSSMSYVWNTGGTGATLTLHTTGWYSVTLLDSNNCEISTDSVYVLVNPEPVSNLTVSASDTLQYCEGQLANVVLQVPGGFTEYAWYLNGGLENTSTDTLNTGILAVGGYSYTAIITDSIGCTSTSAPIGIDVRALPSLQASVTDANCYGDTNGVVSLTVTGNGGYSFIWSNGDTTATILNLGADTLTVFVTDSFSCESTIDVVVNQPTAIAATTSQSDVDCFGGNNGSITVSASGGSGPYVVDWTSATGTSSGDVAVSFQVNMGGQTWIGDIELYVQSFGTHIMTDFAGDSIYRKTLTFMPGDTIFYRYAKSSVPENVPSSCGIITGSTLLQRYVVIPSKDTTLSIVCFASCTDCDGAVRGNANGAFMTTARSLNGLTAGVYTFNMVDLNGCPQSVTDTVDQPSLLVTVVDTIYDATCPQNNDGGVELHATGGVAPYNYQWSNGSSQNNQLFLYAGMYSVLITDMNGCTDSSSFILDAPQPFGQQEICVLSVDSLTGKNLIVWEHTPGYRTSDYVLFKENSQGQYVQIGTQAYTNMSIYTDVTSIPQQQPDRYRMAVMDSCGTMSDTSVLHRTIHLQSNIGSGGEINLIWTPYEGRSVQTYEIFRWITAGNMVQIGSVSGGTTTFTDLNPPVAPNVYYVINAVFNGDACSPTLGKTTAFEGSKSNILNQTGIGTPELPWRGRVLLYPNPSTGNFRIEVPTDEEYQVVIYNAVGKRLLVKSYMDTAEINLENVAEGLYYVEIHQEGSVMGIEKINIVH